jgi:hypothetical protein
MNRRRPFATIALFLPLSLLCSRRQFSAGFAQTLQVPSHKPLVLPLQCEAGDCPLLTGVPQTAGMRSGLVRLEPGASVGWHTTATNEEQLVVIHGLGKAEIDNQPARLFAAPSGLHSASNASQRHQH